MNENTNKFANLLAVLAENTGKITVVTDVKTQKEAIEADAPKVWDDFKVYLAGVNYALTPTKRVLCDVGGMTAADYTRMTNLLDTLRACIIDWQSAKMRLDDDTLTKAKKKEVEALCEIKRSDVYSALKGIKAIFDIDVKSKSSDIEWLANRTISVKYRDRTNIRLGYTLSVSGNMSVLTNIFKLVSASHDGQTALINAGTALIKRKSEGIKSAVTELSAAEKVVLVPTAPDADGKAGVTRKAVKE